jgi:hypothetical protein
MKREFVKKDIDIDPFFFDMFSRLGSDVEYENFPEELSGYSPLLEPFLERLYAKNNQSPPKLKDSIDLPCYNIEENKKVLVAISGGHDSLAVAIQLKKDGYEPILFHIPYLNKAFPRETTIVRSLKDTLGMPLIEFHIKVTGKRFHMETPIKNFFILGAMVDYGVKHNIHNYSFGNSADEANEVSNSVLGTDYSDSYEPFIDLHSFYQYIIPNFKQHIPLENTYDAYKILFVENPILIDNISSCMLRDMYLKNVRKANKRKFPKVQLGKYSCGSCRKCVLEYFMVGNLKDEKYDLDYVKKCMETLNKHFKNLGKETYKTTDYKSILTSMIYDKKIETEIMDRIKA